MIFVLFCYLCGQMKAISSNVLIKYKRSVVFTSFVKEEVNISKNTPIFTIRKKKMKAIFKLNISV